MKKLTLIILCIFMIIQGFSSTKFQTYLNDTELLTYSEEFYRDRIPEEFIDAFLFYTEGREEMRLPFYSLMVHESVNFKYMVSRNHNGSYDRGPSQLNDSNLKNQRFLDYYDPKDKSYINTTYTYYMVLTINFFWDLYTKYGMEYALYAYNGGERCVSLIKTNNKEARFESLLANVKAYDSKVKDFIEKHNSELTKFVYSKQMNSMIISKMDKNIEKIIPLIRNYRDIFTNINEPVDDMVSDLRRQYFVDLKSKELIIGIKPVIGRFIVQIA